MRFDKTNLKALQNEILSSLAEIERKRGVKFDFSRGKFNADNAALTLEVSAVAESGVVMTRERTDFLTYAHAYGLRPEWLGKTFRSNGSDHTIIGLMPKKRVRPVLTTAGGRQFLFTAEVVRRLVTR